jgi:hypothetical protein
VNTLPEDAATDDTVAADIMQVEAASQPFVGRWNHLVSTTNWEKGRIITEWRSALIAAGANTLEYSDEAWARRVGGVTGQHSGRLRRVYQRFGKVYRDYRNLYWSHFCAALDWDDPELWLEGAVQSGWSVSEMRRQRWEALGAVAAERPRDEDIVTAEQDEDFDPALNREFGNRQLADAAGGPLPEGPDFGDETTSSRERDGAAIFADEPPGEAASLMRPFENLADLPNDLADAFERFKLALLRHKSEHWREISCEDVLAALDALKELAVAPSVE